MLSIIYTSSLDHFNIKETHFVFIKWYFIQYISQHLKLQVKKAKLKCRRLIKRDMSEDISGR